MLMAVIEARALLLNWVDETSVVFVIGILRLATAFLIASVAANVCSFADVQFVAKLIVRTFVELRWSQLITSTACSPVLTGSALAKEKALEVSVVPLLNVLALAIVTGATWSTPSKTAAHTSVILVV